MCKGIIRSGTNKGTTCTKASVDDDGYCNRHQRDKEYDAALASGQFPCRFFFRGCNNMLDSQATVTCNSCIITKRKHNKKCEHDGCTNYCDDSLNYCGLHTRDYYRKYEIDHGVKICNIDRGCFNVCQEDYQSCKICILNHYIMNNRWFEPSFQNNNKCITCETSYESSNISDLLKRCPSCVDNLLLTYKNKKITQLVSYSECKKENPLSHYNEYIRGCDKRGIVMHLTLDEFKSIIDMPCHYCNIVASNYSAMGIDRIDNNSTYTRDNVVPCCNICNRMKGSQTLDAFINKCVAISKYRRTGVTYTDILSRKYDMYISSKYTSYKSYVTENSKRDRVIDFKLTEDEYNNIKQGVCYLCGIAPSIAHYNGIDRKDDNCGYIISNCYPCCYHCNTMKFQIPIGIFLAHIEQIVTNTKFAEYICSDTLDIQNKSFADGSRFRTKVILQIFTDADKTTLVKYCKLHNRSDEFIHKICSLFETASTYNAGTLYNKVKAAINAENQAIHTYKVHNNMHKKTGNVLSMLETGKLNEYCDWYTTTYGEVTPLFREKLVDLVSRLPTMSHSERFESCNSVLYAEKNRRGYRYKSASATPVTPAPAPVHAPVPVPALIVPPSTNSVPALPARSETRPLLAQLPPPPQTVPSVLPTVTTYSLIYKGLIPEPPKKEKPLSATHPKQWKVADIYRYIRNGNESVYHEYCLTHNDIFNIPEWTTRWNELVETVRVSQSSCAVTDDIEIFVKWLRSYRHNKAVADKYMETHSNRTDREVWTSVYIAHLFQSGKINEFKAHTEAYTGDTDTDSKWRKRWADFTASLEAVRDNKDELVNIISKFMACQRTKKLRRKNTATAATAATPTLS
jgi:hypothetical protein